MKPAFYSARPVEVAKNPKVAAELELVARACPAERQQDVFLALWSCWNFSQAFDDILDAGHLPPAARETLLRECAEALPDLLLPPAEPSPAVNHFIDEYKHALNGAGMDDEARALAEQALYDFCGNLVSNPVYTEHGAAHLAMFHSMIFRCLKGDEMAGSDKPHVRELAPAVRCADLDFIVHVAYLIGGWEVARRISRLMEYDTAD